MAYTKQTWADLPSKTTPINASRLTHIEDGIFNAAATADNAASAAGTAAANVGIVSGKVETLTERVNGLDTAVSNKVDKVAGKGLSTNDYNDTDKGKVDSLGTASTKNSTSVVTDSSDLVESGAVKDIVGWGNKNLANIPDKTIGDGLFISDTSVNLPIGTYTLSFTVSGTIGTDHAYQVIDNSTSPQKILETADLIEGRNSITFTTDAPITKLKGYTNSSNTLNYSNFQLEVGSTATAYEPYHASVEEYCASKELLEDTVGWVGKNLLEIPSTVVTNTINGVTYTVYRTTDGAVEKIEINGTASANSRYSWTIPNVFENDTDYKIGKWEVQSATEGKNVNFAVLFIDTAYTYILNCNQTEKIFTTNNISTSRVDNAIFVENGTTINATLYPSVRYPTIDEQKCDTSVIATVEDGATASQAYAVGEHFIRGGAFCTVTQAISQGGTFTLNTNYTSGDVTNSLIYTVDYTILNLSALTWNAPTGSQLSYAKIATGSVLPSNAKLIGAIICEPWNSGINVAPIIAIASDNLNMNLIKKQSDTPGGAQLTIRLTYILI